MIVRPARLALLAFVCACVGTPAAQERREERSAEPDTVVRKAEVHPLETLYDSVTLDVDGDGTAERIELGSNIPDDRSAMDVHHRWSVIVRDGPDSYPLLHEYVPGSSAFWVIPSDSTRPAAILVQTSAVYGPTEGVRLERFVFDRARDGYVRTGLIREWARHAVYRGPPGYENEVPPTGKGRHDHREHDN